MVGSGAQGQVLLVLHHLAGGGDRGAGKPDFHHLLSPHLSLNNGKQYPCSHNLLIFVPAGKLCAADAEDAEDADHVADENPMSEGHTRPSGTD